MGTRSLTALDYFNSGTHKVPRRVSTLPLADLQQTYLPAQPVLSSRTVDIDLPGTRTYRQKSTLDIIEEQQRLIRQLYMKPRVPVSAPPRDRSLQTPRSLSESNIGKVNIEVKGRPFTSGATVSATYKENSPVVTHRRPKTAGPLKHVCPLTNCHRAVTEDRDLLAISHSGQKLRKELHSYWKTEVKSLAVGKFVRGQKFLDEALPNLDSWLTFGGAAGINGQGVIDAFASFRNSEDYYNIKGSVGSHVARQLQKGGKIRIGINGILQTQDFKVKKRNNNKVAELKATAMLRDNHQNVNSEGKDESLLTVEESTTNPARKEMEAEDDRGVAEEVTEAAEHVTNTQTEAAEHVTNTQTEAAELFTNIQTDRSSPDVDFGELVISQLDDFQEEAAVTEIQKPSKPVCVEMNVDTAPEASVPSEEAVRESLKLATPLSWSDQYSRTNIKIIHANLSQKEISKPVMSETFPVKFHKLTDGTIRPNLVVKPEGFKIKQRSAHEPQSSRENSSKVKVVYIDPLTTEEDEIIKGLSVDSIINHKIEGRSKVSSSLLISHEMSDEGNKNPNANTEGNKSWPHHASSTQSEPRSHYSTTTSSVYGDRASMYSPKLKVTPVHSSAGHKVGNLRIMSANAGHTSQSKDVPRNGRTPRKLAPAKLLHRTSAGQGSSIKAGPLKGEPEYIKIISQLKITSSSSPAASLLNHVVRSDPGQISAGRNSPEVMNSIAISEAQSLSDPPEGATEDLTLVPASSASSRKSTPIPTDDCSDNIYDLLNKESYSEDVEFPTVTTSPETTPAAPATVSPATLFPTTTAISIPTADEEFSSHLPAQYRDNDISTDLNN